MVADLTACPFCRQTEPVIRFGTNQSGSARCRCKDGNKTFTPVSKSRKTTPEKEQQIERALRAGTLVHRSDRAPAQGRQKNYLQDAQKNKPRRFRRASASLMRTG
jgi:transposase-like protein